MEKLFKCLMLQLFCTSGTNAQVIMLGDIVINEILFNPVKDGFDYVEIYNRSSNAIDLNEVLIANRNSAHDIGSVKSISKESLSIPPAGYVVITTNRNWLKQQYIVHDSSIVIQISSLPSFPDDQGCVVLLRKTDSSIIEELCYDENWHFKMLRDHQGVALERIDFRLPAQEKNNWTSASSSSGFGTPGHVNSQYRDSEESKEEISVLPAIFTPDNDGQNDFASINIKTAETGKVVNAIVFSAMGRRVRYLLKNETLGVNNRFVWDGYDDKDQLSPSGIYIIFIQIFDAKGSVKKYRNCIVLNSFPP